jgi:hypothetical protein
MIDFNLLCNKVFLIKNNINEILYFTYTSFIVPVRVINSIIISILKIKHLRSFISNFDVLLSNLSNVPNT